MEYLFVSEIDFKETKLNIDDELWEVGNEVLNKFSDEPYNPKHILSDKTGKKLKFILNRYKGNSRSERETMKNCYRITIEKFETPIIE